MGGFNQKDLFIPALKMILAAVLSAIVLYLPVKALDTLIFDTTKTINLILLTGIASFVGLGTYILLVWLFKVKELETFSELIKKICKLKWAIKSEEVIQTTDHSSTL